MTVFGWRFRAVVLGKHTTIPCFCYSIVLPIVYIWLNMISMSSLIVLQFCMKNSIPMPSRPDALFSLPLCNAVCFSPAVTCMSSMSNYRSANLRCPAFAIWSTHSSFICMVPCFHLICPQMLPVYPFIRLQISVLIPNFFDHSSVSIFRPCI